MAGIIAMAGNTIHAYQNSLLQLHSPSTCCCGNANTLRGEADLLDKLEQGLITTVAERTGQSPEDIKAAYFDGSDYHFLTAAQCLELKLIDVIENTSAILPKDLTLIEDKLPNMAAVNIAYKNFSAPTNKEKPHTTATAATQKPVGSPYQHCKLYFFTWQSPAANHY